MRVFNIRCECCQHTWEDMVEDFDTTLSCKYCSKTAHPILTGCNFSLDGTDPAFPTANERWAKDHERRARDE